MLGAGSGPLEFTNESGKPLDDKQLLWARHFQSIPELVRAFKESLHTTKIANVFIRQICAAFRKCWVQHTVPRWQYQALTH